MATQHGACAVHAGQLRLHTHTHTHWEYVILIAFPRKRGLHERASMLRYTYIACLVTKHFFHNCCAVGFTSQSNSTATYIVTNCKYVLRVAITLWWITWSSVSRQDFRVKLWNIQRKFVKYSRKLPSIHWNVIKITKRGKTEEMLQFHFLQCKLTYVQQLFVITIFDMI